MSFQNLYYKRTAGTAKACFVCYRPTTTVLATINTVDFVYACDGHLSDANFASKVKDNGAKKEVTAEEIAKVKEEWEEKERRRKEKEKEAAKAEKEKKDGDGKDKDKDKDKEKKKDEPRSPVKSSPTSATPSATHERYILHRDFFAMRQAEHRRRRQTAQAKELGPRLPGVPSGSVG